MGTLKNINKSDYYYSAQYDKLTANYKNAGIPLDLLEGFDKESFESVKFTKAEAEIYLSYKNQLHTDMKEIMDLFLTGTKSLYASFHIDNPEYIYSFKPHGMYTTYKYGIEIVPIQFWFTRYRSSGMHANCVSDYCDREYHIGNDQSSHLIFSEEWFGTKRKNVLMQFRYFLQT